VLAFQRHHPVEAARQAARAIRDASPGVVCSGVDLLAASPATEAREAIEELRRRVDLAPSVKEGLDRLDHGGAALRGRRARAALCALDRGCPPAGAESPTLSFVAGTTAHD
jgi:hypothetical protein